MNSKKWIILVLGLSLSCLAGVALLNYVVDPCFHYRKPISKIKYILVDERYQNDGILKHFDYDALIVGTSMTENFKTTEADDIFNVKSIKTPYSGATYKEINDAVNTAIENNDDLKIVIRSLDLSKLETEANEMASYIRPTYLYDEELFNDLYYLLNLDISRSFTGKTIIQSLLGRDSTTFDEYCNWSKEYDFSPESVLKSYERPEPSNETVKLSSSDRIKIENNIRENVTSTIENNPDISFYYFIPPYSILFWDSAVQKGELEREIEKQRILIEELVQYDNCYLFSWFDDIDMVSDLNNYIDIAHYGEWINTEMLNRMNNKEGLITEDNYESYLDDIYALYKNYNYVQLFDNN